MSTIEQLPGDLGLVMVIGDEFKFTAIFNVDLTNYTLTSAVVNSTTQETVFTLTPVQVVQTVAGAVQTTLSFDITEAQTSMLTSAAGARYRWFLRWVTPSGETRTVLSGKVKAQTP